MSAALDPRASVSLQASAGSGKTWQLVSRVLRLLLDGAEPGGILAVTFTRKAATEMRLRLNERLRALAEADAAGLDDALRRLGLEPSAASRQRARQLYRALLFATHPPRAMTLHAFCQELLARFALDAGVKPGFALLENESELIERAWLRLQAQLSVAPQSAPALALSTLVDLGHGEWSLRQLVEAFLQRRGEWRAYTEGVADPVAHATQRLRAQLGACDAAAACAAVDADAFTFYLRSLVNWLREWGNVGSVRADPLEPALSLRAAARLAALEDALLRDDGEPYAFKPGRKFSADQARTLGETHAEVLRRFQQARAEWLRAETLARSGALFTLGHAALGALDEELAREHALGFSELEWHTWRLLRTDGAADWIRCRLDRRVDHLLVDEFQDTSPTQWRMLLPLLQEMAAGDAGRARSAFIVGDAKQSIYGFRRADPRLLGRATAWMQQHLGARVVPLHESRRSAPAVINFVNALLGLDDPAGAALAGRIGFERHDTHRKDDWGHVEVALPIDQDGERAAVPDAAFRDPLTQPRRTREDLRAEREAALVSARIQALVASGVEVRAESGPRAIGYGDIFVLARQRTHLHHLERRLTADGVPFVGAARGTLLETSVARDLTALLRLLDAPHRDLELAQVLRSPLFGAADAALVRLARDARAHGGRWLDALTRVADGDAALERARALIAEWRQLTQRLPTHDLLDRILRDTDAAARYEAALPRVTGARARANLGAFLQLALESDSGRNPSLPRFLRWLEAQARAYHDAPDEAPPAAVADHVRIMTIHAAKGLEAPAVFLYNAGGALAPRAPKLLVDWPENLERPALMMVSGAAARLDFLARDLAERHKEREAREDLNLLYVALTRARQFLHVSGFRPLRPPRASWHNYALQAMEMLDRAAPLPGTAAGSLCHASGTSRAGAVPPAAPPPPADLRLRTPFPAPAPRTLSPSARAGLAYAAAPAEAADRGTAIHYLLQRLDEGAEDDATLQAETRARLASEPTAAELAAWLAEARAVRAAPPLARFFEPSRHARAWNEVPVALDGTPAVIDRLVDDGDTLWVLDYKTHRRPDAAALTEAYRPQLAAYVEAVRTIWPGRPVGAGLVLTATRVWVPVIGPSA